MKTFKFKTPYSSQLDELNSASASVWNECLALQDVWDYAHGYKTRGVDKQCELWMDKQLSKSQPLHSQSIQTTRARYFKNRKAHRALVKNGHYRSKAPHRPKRFQTTTYLKSAIRIKGDKLVLSNGRNADPLIVDKPKKMKSVPKIINLVYNRGQYELHCVYGAESTYTKSGDGVAGVDLGEIHPMVSFDGHNTTIFNGRYIRSLYRLRNKVLASINSKIDRCKRHSKRFSSLVRRKWKRIRKIDDQIMDCLHKHTAKFVGICVENNIGTIVIGDLTSIRENIAYGKRANQKLHQWSFGKLTTLIEYKAKSVGISVKKIDESYTSQTCPQCGNRKKPTTRTYKCKCGFEYHRDGVGAINIRQKYLGHLGDPVEAAMAPPVGIRIPMLFYSNRKCYHE